MSSLESEKRPISKSQEFLGQPKGLFVLYGTELWERLSFYGMTAILVPFLTSAAVGMVKEDAVLIGGLYSTLVYLMCIPAGPLADRFLGARLAVLLGAIAQCIGHVLLGIPGNPIWFASGVFFLCIGTGLLKTNISSMVGNLYGDKDKRREKGFSIFYQGINVGSILGIFATPYIAKKYGYHYGFASAAIGMCLSLIIFVAGRAYLKSNEPTPKQKKNGTLAILGLTLIGGLLLVLGNFLVTKENFSAVFNITNYITIAGIGACLLFGCTFLFRSCKSTDEKNKVKLLMLVFLATMLYIVIFIQLAGMLEQFAKTSVQRTIRLFGYKLNVLSEWFFLLDPAFIVLFGIPAVAFWNTIRQKKSNLSPTTPIGSGLVVLAVSTRFIMLAFRAALGGNRISVLWMFAIYFFVVIGELFVMPPSLSAVSEYAPKHLKSTIMGLLWGFISLGGAIGGRVAKLSCNKDPKIAMGTLDILTLVFLLLGVLYVGLNSYTYKLAQSKEATKKPNKPQK